VRLDAVVTNEQLSLMTARRCGIEVPDSFIVNTGNGEEHEILFAAKRYDRVFPAARKEVSGMPCPLRLHQEDFAQALGIPVSAKYERGEEHYLKDMFDLLRQYSSDPVSDQLKLWDMIVFNCLIGNTDAHIKNFSLLYGPDLKKIRLAPAYDIVSTAVYAGSTREMAFRIGEARNIDEITEDSFRAAAGKAGLSPRMAMRRFESIRERFRPALRRSAEELSSAGYPKAAEIERRILAYGGIGRTEPD
jgi:serine/threonine-protein kinase HipA